MLCIQECTPVETWLKMFLKQDGWNEVKEFVGRGRSITAMGCQEAEKSGEWEIQK